DNLGNTRLTASISGSDNGDHLSYDIHPSNVQIEPGRAAFVKATLKPRQIIWFGSKEQRPYTLAIQRSGTGPQPVEGTYVQRGFLPRWLATFLGVFMALAITFVMLWIAYKPQVRTSATEKLQEAGISTLPPSPSTSAAPPTPPSPSAQAPVVPSAPETQAASGSGGGGGSSETKPKESAEPQEDTAATAVAQLAAQDPGRHICYRAYLTDKGWTKPVCDGAMAGTVGENRPIKSLNLATSDTDGTAATAFVYYPQSTDGKGHYNGPWKGVVDGADLYIGSTKKDDPYMLGFAMNVGQSKSVVCQTVHVHNEGWKGLGCDEPGGDNYIFGGTLSNLLWLEAVKFTV
ncbi:hydrolase, partial [Streptomyces mirabilis]|uniref:hydrolase n=1 Tax=Streptomyces mirabilis TaxID=68239 RepID=UPI0036AE58DB